VRPLHPDSLLVEGVPVFLFRRTGSFEMRLRNPFVAKPWHQGVANAGAITTGGVASSRSLMYEDAVMQTRPRTAKASSTGFAGETLRALSAAVLLLGLIGDRRAR
jgi:hypothetical protein